MTEQHHLPEDQDRRLRKIEERLSAIEAALKINTGVDSQPTSEESRSHAPIKVEDDHSSHLPRVIIKQPQLSNEEDPERITSEVAALRGQIRRTSKEAKLTDPPESTPSQASTPRDIPLPKGIKIETQEPAPESTPDDETESTITRCLKALRLVPPDTDTNAEVEIASWWAIRVGIILGVIGIVFFGVYAAKNMTPIMRIAEISALWSGILFFGHRLERRDRELGRIVFSAGLALAYFTSYASYTILPMKVVDSASIATMLQMATAAGIILCSFWKRSEPIATFAVALGYVACIFSFSEGLHTWSLASAFILAAGTTVLHIKKHWWRPTQAAIPLTYIVYLLVGVGEWVAHDTPPSYWVALGYLVGYMLIFAVGQFMAEQNSDTPSTRERKITALMNTSLAVVSGFILFNLTPDYRDFTEVFYFVMGGVLLSGGLLYMKARKHDAVGEIMFVKGTALLSLGFIAWLDGMRRWISLMAQSAALLWAWRRNKQLYIELPLVATWLVAYVFFITELIPQASDQTMLFSLHGLISLGFLFSSIFLCSLYIKGAKDDIQKYIAILTGVLIGIVAPMIVTVYVDAHIRPVTHALLVVPVFISARVLRQWMPLIVASIIMLFAHLSFGVNRSEGLNEWMNGLTPIIITLLCLAAGMAFRQSHERFKDSQGLDMLDSVWHVIWMISLTFLYHVHVASNFILFAGATTGMALLLCRHPRYFPRLSQLSFFPAMAAAFYYYFGQFMTSQGHLWPGEHWVWLSLIVYLAFDAVRNCMPRLTGLQEHPEHKKPLSIICCITAGTLLAIAINTSLTSIEIMAGFAAGALVLSLVMSRFRAQGYWYMGVVLMLVGHLAFYATLGRHMHELGFVTLALCTAAATLAFAVTARFSELGKHEASYNMLLWISGVATLIMLFTTFSMQDRELDNHVTVLWGLSSILLFVLGLIFRARPFRLIGLGGLALCLPRMFLIDINETLHRIAAFCAVSIVLLIIGFLYRRYQHLIDD